MERLKTLIPSFEGKNILIIGDLMLDEHIWSAVSRISPEAPVPIANVEKITHVPGGCGNVAANVKTLGGTPVLISLIGFDSSGEKLIQALGKQKISTKNIIKSKERPTILKSRIIAGSQQVIRVDREDLAVVSRSVENLVLKRFKRLVRGADGIILSDYGKGLLTERVCREMIAVAKHLNKPLAVDPKGSDYSRYRYATVITPNLREAEIASGITIKNEFLLKKAGQTLLKQSQAKYIVITRGKDGLSIFGNSDEIIHVPAIPREVFDITGAGDTVIAALSLALSAGAGIKEAAEIGNYAASVAVTKIGTQPVYKDELEEALEEKEPAGKKIKSRPELAKIIKRLKSRGAKIVFTNGCFDILHLGHVRYLREAKKMGDVLIVGLNADSSVKKLKGSSRPYVGELERAEVLASLECVDYISIFSELRPDNLIKIVKPDIHIKGGDYKIKDLPEARLVKSLGGKVMVIPPIPGRSTTSIIERIKSALPVVILAAIILSSSTSAWAWRMTPELRAEIREKEAVVRKNPNSAQARFDLASTYSYSNKILEAWDELKKIPELDPEFKQAGLDYYVKKVTDDPADWKLRFRLAFALYFNGRKLEAIEQFKNVLISDPYNVWAYGYIALAYGEMEKTDQAILWAKKGIKIDNLVAALHLLLSAGYYKKGDNWNGFREAAEAIRLKAFGY